MRIKVRYFSVIWSILFSLYFFPATYVIGSGINSLKNWLIYLLFIILFIIKLFSKKLPGKTTTWILIFFFIWSIAGSSVINIIIGRQINISNLVSYLASSISFILLCDIGFSVSEKKTLKCLLLVGMTMCTLNALSFFIYYNSGGMYHGETLSRFGRKIDSQVYFLLGRDNATYFQTWPIIVVAWYYYFKFNTTRAFYLVCALFSCVIVSAYFYTWSAMAAFSCLATGLSATYFTLKREQKKARWIYDIRKVFFYGLLFNMLLSAQILLPYLLPMVRSVFLKSNTLTSRTILWERSYRYIFESPIIGYGTELDDLIMKKLGINHTHNMFLETIYRGGIVGLGILTMYVNSLGKCKYKIELKHVRFIFSAIFIFLISASVEFAFYRFHFVVVFLLLTVESEKDYIPHSSIRIKWRH